MFGLEGEIFGLLDNGVLAICALLGIDIDQRLGRNGVHGALFGGLIGNSISDAVGAIADPALRDHVIGITAGCLEVFVAVWIGVRIWQAFKTA
tara:strand:+ start:484 stop:762 length:279 start_codon:yes stop_codon:yes gene_type:complete